MVGDEGDQGPDGTPGLIGDPGKQVNCWCFSVIL